MLRLAFDFIITWRETRTRPNAYLIQIIKRIIHDNRGSLATLWVILCLCLF